MLARARVTNRSIDHVPFFTACSPSNGGVGPCENRDSVVHRAGFPGWIRVNFFSKRETEHTVQSGVGLARRNSGERADVA